MVEARTTALSIDELCAATGLSRRTFHRWFPSKERVLRPYYAAITEALLRDLATRGPVSIDAVCDAWERLVLGPEPEESAAIFSLVRADHDYWSVFLEVLEESEGAIAAGLTAGDPELDATVAAVAIVAASRLALAAEADVPGSGSASFRRTLEAFDPAMLRAER